MAKYSLFLMFSCQLGDFEAFKRPLGDQYCQKKSPLRRLWSNLKEFWDLSQKFNTYWLGTIPDNTCTRHWEWSQILLFFTFGSIPDTSCTWQIPISQFLTARTDPNVIFGLCSITCLIHTFLGHPVGLHRWHNKSS